MAGDQTTNSSQNDPDKPSDWQQIGKAIAAGMDAIGFVEKLGKAVISGSVDATRKARAYTIKAVAVLFAAIVGALFDLIGQLDPAFGSLAATIVGNMFEIPVDASAFTNMKAQGGRKQIAVDVGAALLRAFKGDQVNAGAGELEPSVTSAESYLGMMANLAIEGWVFEVIGGLVPDLQLEELGELKDAMARVLGLGRLSRTVLHPFVNTLIAQPATWAVNKQYRPKMLTVSEAIAAWHRGDVDEGTVDEIAARDGYGDDAIAALKNAALTSLAPADAKLLVDSSQIDEAFALEEIQRAGHPTDRAQLLYGLERVRELRRFELEMLNAAVSAYAEHRITDDKLLELLSATTLDSTQLARLHELAAQRRLVNAPHLSHAEVIAAVKRNVLNITDYAAWLTARGYTDVDAVTLELSLQDELTELADKAKARAAAAATRAANAAAKLQALQMKRDQIAGEHAHWTGTLGEAERLVVRAVMPPTQYQQVLVDHNLSPGDAAALVTVAVADRDARAAAQAKKAAAAATTKNPTLSLAALERAVLLGALTLAQFDQEAAARGYAAGDVTLMHDELVRELADRTALQAKRDAAAAGGGAKALSLAQLETAVVDGARTLDQFRAAVVALKYSDVDVAALVAHVQAKVADRQLALERHALADAKLTASHVSLGKEETAVVDGILTMADYEQWLQAHGFDAGDVAVMVALLQTKLK